MSCCCDPTETSAFGAITKYTIGPAWTGAEFATIQAAVDAAVSDGHSGATFGQTILLSLYPGVYADPVVIPATLPRWNLVGTNNTVGSAVTGAFTIQLPTTNAGFGIDQVRFSGGFNVTQAGVPSGTISARFFNVTFLSATTVSSTNLVVEAYDCVWGSGVVHTWTHRNVAAQGGRFLGTGVFDCGTLGGTQFLGTYIFTTLQPILTFRGRACSLESCLVYYSGAPCVLDECTDFSEYTRNTLSRNAGPIASWVRKTGASSLTDGGNIFVDGSTYPYFEILGGTRPNRGRNDDELRDVISVAVPAGPVVQITPAQLANLDLLVQVTTGGGVLELPPILSVPKAARVTVKRIAAASFIVQGAGINFIDGAASISILNNRGCLTFQSDGAANWNIVGSYLVP